MSCNHYTDMKVRPERHFCLMGISQKTASVLYTATATFC